MASHFVAASQTAVTTDCEFTTVRFVTDFSMGRLDGCEQVAEHRFVLHLRPENTPINPSPWYAFRAENLTDSVQEIQITLQSHNGPARYLPKASVDKQRWLPVAHRSNDNRLQFQLALQPATPLYIAGQEIIDNRAYTRWLASLAQEDAQEILTLGYSTEGRPLPALMHYADGNSPSNNPPQWLVLIGRQHPPEITGALAMLHFTNWLFSDDELANRFRARFNILVAPNMNPDGVQAGNWRHTSTGLDMNRDWRQRTQPETQALHAMLEQLVDNGEELVFALDFHSTWRNIYYTMPASYVNVAGNRLYNRNFVDQWLAQLEKEINWEVVNRPGHNQDSGVFKQYMADAFGIHAVTYEVGDNTDREEIKITAEKAARVMAQQMLQQ